MKLLQQAPRQGGAGSGSGWSGGPMPGLGKPGKPLNLLQQELQQEAERLYKQQHRAQQQQRVNKSAVQTPTLSMIASSNLQKKNEGCSNIVIMT